MHKLQILRSDASGYGDILQLMQIVPRMLETHEQVIYVVPKAIYSLVRHSLAEYPNVVVTMDYPTTDETEDNYDTRVWFMLMLEAMSSIKPPGTPFIKVPAGLRYTVNRQKFNVGIAWSSHHARTKIPREQDTRSTSLEVVLHGLQDIPNIVFYCLQTDGIEDAEDFRDDYPNLRTYSFTDFADTARLVRQLDCVVTIDTVILHLAGGLGIPTYMMASIEPFKDPVEFAQWYNSVKIFPSRVPQQPDARDPHSYFDSVNQIAEYIRGHT